MKQIHLNKEGSLSKAEKTMLQLIQMRQRKSLERLKGFIKWESKAKILFILACAISMQCEYFLTTDDELIKKASGIKEIKTTE